MAIKINRAVYKFIEHELYHYDEYKKELATERERIIESSGNVLDGMPKGHVLSDTTMNKAISLMSGAALLSLERRTQAIENGLRKLTGTHTELFKKYYCQSRRDTTSMCNELHIAERTFFRYKNQIVIQTGIELGIIYKPADS